MSHSDKSELERSQTRIRGFNDAEMDFQLLRMLGVSCYGGASIGECLHLVNKIPNSDTDAWVKQFANLADHVTAQAKQALAHHKITARELFLKACNYYRSAEYYCDPYKPLQRELGLKSHRCFLDALKLFDIPATFLKVPFDDTFMPAYFMQPNHNDKKRKTIIIVTGFDGSGEEMYFQCAVGALQRGFNVLIFDGPGQTGMIRHHPNVKFRPDYETPIGHIIDYALTLRQVDPDKLAIYGISFGGYFASRAAAHDNRIKAVILNSPIIDLYAYMVAFIGREAIESDEEDITVSELDHIPDSKIPKGIKLSFKASCFKFGTHSFHSYLEKLQQFKVGDAIKNITCPSLTMIGEGEGKEPQMQAATYAKAVSGPVTERMFTTQEGADAHCQLGNLSFACAVSYDWLDDIFVKEAKVFKS